MSTPSENKTGCMFYERSHRLADSVCNRGLFDGKPTEDNCMTCESYIGPVRGAGDAVHKILHKIGVNKLAKKAGCNCNERRRKLNTKFPRRAD